ncbi:type I-D CRISPR-associated protein Cas5/Csc1 [Thermotoga caldifontis]|uniref:type I-D CRISPR-associated protein Cas5/Csc1 n=2 Tax=Thermotogaceae TaxID=188709 RepID=UPI00059718E6|nr:type I-D CRISPR-associated protein Cas5/Csc1 [Thermotoga caldifontis]MBC7123186.1 type I-D CRISPR-associated protein Cas5/Csc1 [Pseudothermotoga sp.]
MYLYRCVLTTHEELFFASKEVSSMFVTVPFIGNYALAYALGFAQQSYVGFDTPRYQKDLSGVKAYVFPAKFVKYNWTTTSFNSIGEGFFLSMEENVVVDATVLREHAGKKPRPRNSPQLGQFKMVAPESVAIFYVLTPEKIAFPKFIRLGKLMSKCELSVELLEAKEREGEFVCQHPINPIDLPSSYDLLSYEVISMKPVPLIENVKMRGRYLEVRTITDQSIEQNVFLPSQVFYFASGSG